MGSAAFPPQHYPWVADTDYAPLEMRHEGRTLMVAVGSNASRAVLTTKLADVGGVDIRPARVVVSGIAAGIPATCRPADTFRQLPSRPPAPTHL